MEDRIKKQFDFIKEIDKEKFISRQTYLTDGKRRENDAEHAWHMALMTVILSEYSNEKIDLLKTITMLLLHDIVEIDAGDTYAYDEDGKKTQHEREVGLQKEFSGFCLMTRGKSLKAFGLSLKRVKQQNQNLLTQWIIFSL